MLTGLHFLLSYMCNSECDHCFVYCSPSARGTFNRAQVRRLLDEADAIGTIEWIYYEGGEPFLFYPIMLEGIKMARERGYRVGIVTNSYFATDPDDAAFWLAPLAEMGVEDFRTSNDPYHFSDEKDNPALVAYRAARKAGLPAAEIHIDTPTVAPGEDDTNKGRPVVGGTTMFRGRAADKLTEGLPRRRWEELVECPHEELVAPGRVHLDSYGNVHICQGISMGNAWKTPLSELVRNYDATTHPICGPLVEGGPALLAQKYDVPHEDTYVDECHFCYRLRAALLDRFPEHLAPPQVYGLEE
jgi:MoaA/NifB/PqqE/SkfB family radical SAM enzyme